MSEYIPDPIERGEMRAESWADENTKGTQAKCIDCEQWFEMGEMVTATPDPYAPLVCWPCAQGLTQHNE